MPRINLDAIYGGATMNAKYVESLNPPIDLEILNVEQRELRDKDGESDTKVCLGFRGEEKELALNKTNVTIMRNSLGNDPDMWKGKTIRLSIISTGTGPGISVSMPTLSQPKSAPPMQCLGPAGEAKLAERMKPANLDLDDLRSHLAGVNDIPNPFLLSEAPAKWPVAWGPLIKGWIDDPAIRASSVPF